MLAFRLTTEDNPFDPFEEFDEWYKFDVSNGYGTTAYLGRVTYSSDELSLADQIEASNEAVIEAFALNLTGNYRIVEREVEV